MAKLRTTDDGECQAGWIERALWQLEAQWMPLSSASGALCFVVDGCADADDGLSADPHPAELAAP